MLHFNAAPGWPPTPPGWRPPAGWVPPADWPPAPGPGLLLSITGCLIAVVAAALGLRRTAR